MKRNCCSEVNDPTISSTAGRSKASRRRCLGQSPRADAADAWCASAAYSSLERPLKHCSRSNAFCATTATVCPGLLRTSHVGSYI